MAGAIGTAFIEIRLDDRAARAGVKSIVNSLKDVDQAADKAARGVADDFQDASRKAGRSVSKIGDDAHRTTGRIGSAFKGVGGLITGAFVGLGAISLFGGFISEAEESQKVGRQTAAVIKSTGAAAGVTAKQVDQLATALSLKTGVDDEAIASGENVLLTFTKIRNEAGKGNDIFNQATKAALDLSVAMGTDLTSANVQVGKALNDPIKGITALRRVGVSFTQQQIDMVKKLVESGDTFGAQKLILKELTTEFGGSAAAQATASAKLGVAWGNIQEQLGGLLLPALNAFASFLAGPGQRAIAAFTGFLSHTFVPGVKALFAAFQEGDVTSDGFVGVMERIGVAARDVSRWLGDHVVPVVVALAGFLVNDLVPAVAAIVQWFNRNRDVLAALAIGLAAVGTVILASLIPAFVAWAVAAGAAAVATILAAAPLVLLGLAVAALALVVIKNWDTIKNVTLTVFHAIVAIVSGVIDWIRQHWPLVLIILTGPIGLAASIIIKNWTTIRNATVAAWNIIRSVITTAWNVILAIIRGHIAVARAIIVGGWNAVRAVTSAAWNAVRSAVSGAWAAIRGIVSGGVNAVHNIISRVIGLIPGTVRSKLAGLASIISAPFRAARDVIMGIINAIKDAISDIPGLISSALSHLPGAGVVKSAAKFLGFQEGGVGDFGTGTPAVLHGREAILPLDNPRGTASVLSQAGLGGVTVNIVNNWTGNFTPAQAAQLSRAATDGALQAVQRRRVHLNARAT